MKTFWTVVKVFISIGVIFLVTIGLFVAFVTCVASQSSPQPGDPSPAVTVTERAP